MATVKSKPTCEMTLSVDEAYFLMNYLQNDPTGNKEAESQKVREDIFKALQSVIPTFGVR